MWRFTSIKQLELEKDPKTWETDIPDSWKPFLGTEALRKEAKWFSTSLFVLRWMPLVFAVLYLLLLIASWCRLGLPSGGV
jgi:hypothetical protein